MTAAFKRTETLDSTRHFLSQFHLVYKTSEHIFRQCSFIFSILRSTIICVKLESLGKKSFTSFDFNELIQIHHKKHHLTLK